jgi:hypothetical protein
MPFDSTPAELPEIEPGVTLKLQVAVMVLLSTFVY